MFATTRAINHFTASLEGFQKSSLVLVSAAAVCFISGGIKEPDTDVADALQKAVGETGLGRSSVFAYISRGRKLFRKLIADTEAADDGSYPVGSTIHKVLDARSPAVAAGHLLDYLNEADVTSADRLDVFLGATPRSERRAAAAKNDGKGANKGTTRAASVPEVGMSPKAILDQMDELSRAVTDIGLARDIAAIWRVRVENLQSAERGAKRVQRAGRGKATHPEHMIHQ